MICDLYFHGLNKQNGTVFVLWIIESFYCYQRNLTIFEFSNYL